MNEINKFFDFINSSTSSYHTVINIEKALVDKGFQELKLNQTWNLSKDIDNYYLKINDSSCIAFKLNKGNNDFFKIIASHTDTPGFKLKTFPEIITNNYIKLNTEVYGGPILNTWLDRPLSLAGRVITKNNEVLSPKINFIDFQEALLTIPNLAIHMNREVNKGIELNKQIDMLPIIGLDNEKLNDSYLNKLLAKKLGINSDKILAYDLFVYNTEKASLLGFDNELISSPRLDNLSMVYTSLEAFLNSETENAINVFASFDNEEIGSNTPQGADSQILSQILERIFLSTGRQKTDFFTAINNSMLISADVAHALHPNQADKHDPILRPALGKGLVIKESANQNYISDSLSIAIFKQICNLANIPYQHYANRSDMQGGSTLGPMIARHLPIKTIELGIPILAMHSAREVMGKDDLKHSIKALKAFYSS